MAAGDVKITDKSYVQIGLVLTLLAPAVALYARVVGVESRVDHLVQGQHETNTTLRAILEKFDIDRITVAEHGAHLHALEQRIEKLERMK